MQELEDAFYEQKFRNRYLEARASAFQDLFSELMEARYPGDFVRVQPWGSTGDRKNDGYLRSKRILFQCFGPKNLAPISKTTKKINEDFLGALPHWKQYFDTWILVHGEPMGLPPQVLETLLAISKKHSPIEAIGWGYPELLVEFRLLDRQGKSTLLGPVPQARDMALIRIDTIAALLRHVELQAVSPLDSVRPVPARKLEHNQLSPAVGILLKAGMSKSDLVKKYLRNLSDPSKADRLSAAFNAQYRSLRAEGRAPDEVFSGLQSLVAGGSTPTPSEQAATLAILAHFFEACDIFERPLEEGGPTSDSAN